MNPFIVKSYWRARVALESIKIQGRNPVAMAELRDGLNERRNIRAKCRYFIWLAGNRGELAFRHARHMAGNLESYCLPRQVKFEDFCIWKFNESHTL